MKYHYVIILLYTVPSGCTLCDADRPRLYFPIVMCIGLGLQS